LVLISVRLTEFACCLRLKIRLLELFAPGVVQARAELLVPGVGQACAKFFFRGVGRARAKSHAGRVGAQSHSVQQWQQRAYTRPRQQDQISNWIKRVLPLWASNKSLSPRQAGSQNLRFADLAAAARPIRGWRRRRSAAFSATVAAQSIYQAKTTRLGFEENCHASREPLGEARDWCFHWEKPTSTQQVPTQVPDCVEIPT
jgi:hypothetical protein